MQVRAGSGGRAGLGVRLIKEGGCSVEGMGTGQAHGCPPHPRSLQAEWR